MTSSLRRFLIPSSFSDLFIFSCSFRFLDLWTELQYRVASHLDQSTRLLLHLTCHQLHNLPGEANALKTDKKRYFMTCSFNIFQYETFFTHYHSSLLYAHLVSFTRPRLSWRHFAHAAMMEGHSNQVQFGLEIGIPLAEFVAHLRKAAMNNLSEVVSMPEFQDGTNSNEGELDFT